MKTLMLIVWSNIPGSSMYKMSSIMPSDLHWNTGIQIINGVIVKQIRYMSLVLLTIIVDKCRLSVTLYKNPNSLGET